MAICGRDCDACGLVSEAIERVNPRLCDEAIPMQRPVRQLCSGNNMLDDVTWREHLLTLMKIKSSNAITLRGKYNMPS